jgi:hypothetical protein
MREKILALSRIIPCVILLWLAVLASARSNAVGAPLIGAIRWDNWTSIAATQGSERYRQISFFEVRDESGNLSTWVGSR